MLPDGKEAEGFQHVCRQLLLESRPNRLQWVIGFTGILYSFRNSPYQLNFCIQKGTTVEDFKRGSEKECEVTTVAGWTIIKTDVQLVTQDGRTLMDRWGEGKVRLFGGNLKATRDLAKKVAKLIREIVDRHTMNAPRA